MKIIVLLFALYASLASYAQSMSIYLHNGDIKKWNVEEVDSFSFSVDNQCPVGGAVFNEKPIIRVGQTRFYKNILEALNNT